MRRIGAWRFEIALLVGLGALLPALGAPPDDEDEAPPQTGWRFAPWIQKKIDRSKPKPKPKKPAAKPAVEQTKAPAAPVKPPPVVDDAGVQRAKEEKAFLRRVAVCDQLLKIAQETRDEELERKAMELNDRAWSLYNDRVAALPAGTTLDADIQVVERHISPNGRSTGTSLYQPTSKDNGSRASREVKP